MANLFLDGLLGDERRKTGWMRAEAAGDPGPWGQQAILGRGRWDAEALRDIVRDYAVEHLATPESVLVIDETGFLKQGKASCGVARQYTGKVLEALSADLPDKASTRPAQGQHKASKVCQVLDCSCLVNCKFGSLSCGKSRLRVGLLSRWQE